MANQGEISVDLRLKMDNVAKDAAKAGGKINQDLASNIKGLPKTNLEREEAAEAAARLRERVIQRRKNAKIEAEYERNRPKPPVLPKTPAQKGFPISPLLAGLGLGIPGVGAIASLAKVHPAAAAVVAGFQAMRLTTTLLSDSFKKAAESARNLYSKSLRSGFGTQFTAQRGLLAKTIGVSDDEVIQFGAAVQYLNGRLLLASKTMADTNRALTASAWNFSVLEADLEALQMKLLVKVAPAFNLFTRMLDAFVNTLNKNSDKILKFLSEGAAAAVLGPIAGKVANLAVEAFGKSGIGKEEAPPPTAFMKQMPASSWEKMGLVISARGNDNYQRKGWEELKKVVSILGDMKTKYDVVQKASSILGFNLPSLPNL